MPADDYFNPPANKPIAVMATLIRQLLLNLLVAAGYWLTGWFGDWLSVAPSNASPIWPAAGVALAALLIGGYRLLPGVLLGAMVTQLNSFSNSDFSGNLADVLAIGAVACLGACLQAMLGTWMIEHWVGKHDALIDERKIARFFILIALSCVVSATASVTALYARDLIEQDDVVWSWVIWWVGDAVGAIILTPLLFLFFAQPRQVWRGRRRYVLMPLLFTLVSVVVAFNYGQYRENQRIAQVFNRQVELISKAVENSLRNHLATTMAVKALYDSANGVAGEEFSHFVQSIADTNNEWLAWAPRVLADQQTDHYPIKFVEPLDSALLAPDYDIGSEPLHAEVMARAIATGKVLAISDQQPDRHQLDRVNTVIFAPVYRRNLPLQTESDRQQAFSGFILNIFHAARDIRLIYDWLGAAELQLRLEIYDGKQRVFSNLSTDDNISRQFSRLEQNRDIDFAGRRLRVRFVPGSEFFHHHHSGTTGWMLLGGLAFCGVAAFGVLLLTGRAARVEELVAERTEDLQRANRTLNQEVALRQRQERELRIAATTFESHDAILVTDPGSTILRVNQAFSQITGYSAEEAIGRKPSILASGYHDKRFFRQMYEELAKNNHWQGEIWNRRKNGEIFPEWLTLTGVRDSDNRLTHYVGIFTDVTEKKAAEREIHNLAFYDPLTALPNRRLLLERLKQEISAAKRQAYYGAVFFLDLDHFKTLNDSRGHQVGDELLIQVAQRLSAIIRDEDTACRLGGDEFIVLIPGRYSKLRQATDHAAMLAEKILSAINQPFQVQGSEHHFSTSIGVTIYPEIADLPEEVIQQADTAMYRAKESGRNSISFFRPSMQEAANKRLILEKELRQAMNEQQFVLHYQPQVDEYGRIVSAEALIRWHHPYMGIIPPAEFVPLAEDTHLILPIGAWVLHEVCRQISEWDSQGKNLRHVAVNVSSRQFRQSGFVEQVRQSLAEHGLTADRIVVELTEGSVIDNIDDTIVKMYALQTMGIKISIDDFGIGYSSLSYLKSLPLSQLKIDQSFVRHIGEVNAAVIVETIIIMAHSLGLNVIAEGVETEEQVLFLKAKGCVFYQGYYFSRPVEADKFPF